MKIDSSQPWLHFSFLEKKTKKVINVSIRLSRLKLLCFQEEKYKFINLICIAVFIEGLIVRYQGYKDLIILLVFS